MIPIPTFSNWLQVAGFVAVLVYMAYLRKVGSDEARTIKQDVGIAAATTRAHVDASQEAIAKKTDAVHELVNGHNEQFKAMMVEKFESDMNNQARLAESAAAKATLEMRESFEKRIDALEVIIASQQKLIAGHAAGPTIAPITPEKRLEEIRGQE